MDFFLNLFSGVGFVPRALCGQWTPGLIRLHNWSDFLIWTAYLAIPAVLVKFAYKRRAELPFRQLFWLFGLFILACGTTHLLEIVLFYHPIYRFSGLVKLITAAASWGTVVALFQVTPRLLQMRMPEDFEQEIEERSEIEDQLRQSETLFRTSFESAALGKTLTHLDGRCIRINKTMCDMVGYSEAEFMALGFNGITHPDDRGISLATLKEVAEHPRQSFQVEKRYLHKHGHIIWVHVSVSPVHDLNGRPLHLIADIQDITARKQAEQELQEAHAKLETRVVERTRELERSSAELQASETRFRLLNEVLPQIVWTAEPDGALDYYNQRWFDYTGMTLEETLGWGWQPVLHPDDVQQCVDAWTFSVQSGEVYQVEYRFKRASDGAYRWHLGRALPLRDENGTVLKWFGTCTDIEDQKQAQQELQRSHLELEQRVGERTAELEAAHYEVERAARTNRNLMEYSQDVICSINAQGLFVSVSAACRKVWGYSPEELCGRPFIELVHPDDVSKTAETDADIVAGSSTKDFENRYVRKDGSIVHMLWSAQWSDSEETIFCVARDITERKRAEEELRSSEERFQLVARATNDVIRDWNLETQELWWNDAFQSVFGYAKQDIKNAIESWKSRLHPDDVERITTDIRQAIDSGQQSWSSEYRFQRADGSYALVRDRGHVVRDANGAPIRMLGSLMDITEAKRAEEELRAAKEAAEEASLAKSQFVANMSHEIRTPMNGVLGPIGLLLDSNLNFQQRELTEIARSSAESLLGIINDILDLSKIEAGKLDIEPIPFDLLLATEETAVMMNVHAEEKGLDLIVRYPSDVPRDVIGDPGRIRQVLSNLVSNATKFTAHGHVLINVEAEAHNEAEVSLRFSVEDTGIGIAPEKIEHIFGRFNQADTSTTRRYGGTGLGLSISQQLVELMGGEIGVQSTLSQGSTFWFTLTLPYQKTVLPKVVADADLRNVRILIVDDNAANRRVLQEQLRGWKLRNQSCASAEEAMSLLHQSHRDNDPFQLAILDHQMPDTDGEELGCLIKNDAELRDTVLVMLTSMGQKGDAARLKSAGFAAYLLKPARQSELLSALTTGWITSNAAPTTLNGHSDASPVNAAGQNTRQWTGTRVLVSEDNVVNQKVATMILQSLGCHVEVAANGLEALRMIETLPFDLIFMDCEMPEMDGYQATQEIRRRTDKKRDLPIIAVTAKATSGDRDRCLRAGMNDYISKPVRSEYFQAALEQWAPRPPQNATETSAPETSATETILTPTISSDAAMKLDAWVAPARQPALDAEVVTNLRELAQATDASLLPQIFGAFLSDGTMRLSALHQALQNRDAEKLHEIAHALKGSSANIGARRMSGIAQELQVLDDQSTLTHAALLVEALDKEFNQVRTEIEMTIPLEAVPS